MVPRKLTAAQKRHKLIDGRKTCIQTVQFCRSHLARLSSAAAKTDLENIWFLESILNGKPVPHPPVSIEDYRYKFIYHIANDSTFTEHTYEIFNKLNNRGNLKSGRQIDLFTNQMVTTGLELYGVKNELIKFVQFLSQFQLFQSEIKVKIIGKAGSCSLPVLSKLYCWCHIFLTSLGYGVLDDFESISPIQLFLESLLPNLVVCFSDLMDSESSTGINIEIVLELCWVLLLCKRYRMDKALPLKLKDNVLEILSNYYNFQPQDVNNYDSLHTGAHTSQLWLLCNKELSTKPIPLIRTTRNSIGGRPEITLLGRDSSREATAGGESQLGRESPTVGTGGGRSDKSLLGRDSPSVEKKKGNPNILL